MQQPPNPLAYFRIVWMIVREIPRGAVATYGQIAAMIPAPEGVDPDIYARIAPRWVGDAMNAVSRADDPDIPWHRVINSKGGVSLPDDSVAAAVQRGRLREEAVMTPDSERVDLVRFGWVGPSADWLVDHGLAPRQPPADDLPHQLSLF